MNPAPSFGPREDRNQPTVEYRLTLLGRLALEGGPALTERAATFATAAADVVTLADLPAGILGLAVLAFTTFFALAGFAAFFFAFAMMGNLRRVGA